MGKRIEARKFGKNTRLTRIGLDLTQTQLPWRINPKQTSISRYETGTSLPSIKTVVTIVKLLKKPAGYFSG